MDHSGHSMPGHTMPMPGHGDMDMEMCSMNMLFTWSTKNLCIVFPAWRVRGPASLILSLLLVVALTAGYEAVRAAARSYDRGQPPLLYGGPPASSAASQPPPSPYTDVGHGGSRALEDAPNANIARSRTPLGGAPAASSSAPSSSRSVSSGARRAARAAFYAVQVFYSFFIMLLFMTYNGWIMLAVAAGAFVGHLMFATAEEGAAKTVACH